jgi:hypothetical protein
MTKLAIPLIMLAGLPFAAQSAETFYSCRIETAYRLTDSGLEEWAELTALFTDAQANEFIVDRRTGAVRGHPNVVDSAEYQVNIIQAGREELPFRAYWEAPMNQGGRMLFVLEVMEQAESTRKPFFLMTDGEKLTGTCQ